MNENETKRLNIKIRPYQTQDLKQLLSAWENASRLAHPFMDESFFDQERHNIPNMYLPNADTWVAVNNEDNLAGFIALIGNEVGGFFVDPSQHNKGFGKSLMEKAQELHGDLVVDVFQENPIGRRFYEHYGFKLIEEKVWQNTGDIILRLAFNG